MNRRLWKLAVLMGIAALGFGAVLLGAGPASATAGASASPMYVFNTTTEIDGGQATLIRDSGVGYFLNTAGLEAGHVVTSWWVIFNHPENCDGDCGLDDVLAAAALKKAGKPDPVGVGVQWAGSKVIGADGKLSIGARLEVGDTAGCITKADFAAFAALCQPVESAANSQIHIVLRDHGPLISALNGKQLASFAGGCDVNACKNVQNAVFDK